MADSNYARSLHGAYPPANTLGAPALRPEPSEPLSSNYAPFEVPLAPSGLPTLNNYSSFHRQLPEPFTGFPPPYLQNRPRQPSHHGGSRATDYLPPAMPMFQQGPNAAASAQPPAPPIYGSFSLSAPFQDCPEPRAFPPLPFVDFSSQSGAPSFSTHLHPWSSGHIADFQRAPNAYSHRTPPTPSRLGDDAFRSAGGARGPMAARAADAGATERPRHMTSPNRRASASHDRQLHHMRAAGGSERRPLSSLLGSPSRRADRSVSPQPSNRRSFDRYSTDLTQPGSTLDPDDATQTQNRPARRPRVAFSSSVRARMLGASSYQDPNVPRPAQMQNLKDKLRHFLPSELPEDASTMCDICQKDYSSEHVEPSEDAEVAIMLPCKHIFGEHCINTWFDTCKTHKNKITCPMCRKLLIEPLRPALEALQSLPAVERRLVERMMHADGHSFLGMARDLQGDFAHS